jgi:NADPH:quinone reductase-like Zn-dependent oxidoreductase
MRVAEIRGGFGLDHLAVVGRPEPQPGPGQVVVRMRAASLNYRDLLMVQGLYNKRQPLPLIPCSDGAGEVLAVGEGVSRVRPGQRVCTLFSQRFLAGRPTIEKMRATLGGPLDGTLAEQVLLDAEGVVPTPEHLTDVEASTLPCAAVTAWSALVEAAALTAGETLLLQGTGGVSIFALQLAKVLGARPLVTSSSDEKLARAAELGAAAGINYRAVESWGEAAKELSGGVGVDLVVEVGGAGTLSQSLRAVRMGGIVALIGNLAGTNAEIALTQVFMRRVRLQGVFVGSRETFEALNRAIALHHLRPIVDRVFPLAEATAAFAYMSEGKHFGKIVIEI